MNTSTVVPIFIYIKINGAKFENCVSLKTCVKYITKILTTPYQTSFNTFLFQTEFLSLHNEWIFYDRYFKIRIRVFNNI